MGSLAREQPFNGLSEFPADPQQDLRTAIIRAQPVLHGHAAPEARADSKPEILAQIRWICPGCYHVHVVNDRCRADLGRPGSLHCR
jgi:hypothetical protein